MPKLQNSQTQHNHQKPSTYCTYIPMRQKWCILTSPGRTRNSLLMVISRLWATKHRPEFPVRSCLLVGRALICPLSRRGHKLLRWDEVLVFPPKLLRESCMAVFWQPVALNHRFMTARENVSVFPPMIYVHWSLEDMIIWPEQMDWEIPKGFCAKRSHAPHKWSPHAGKKEPDISVHLLNVTCLFSCLMNYTYVQLYWAGIKSHNS